MDSDYLFLHGEGSHSGSRVNGVSNFDIGLKFLDQSLNELVVHFLMDDEPLGVVACLAVGVESAHYRS